VAGVSNYGDEIDLSAALPIGKNYGVTLKYADFGNNSDVDAVPGLQDTTKFWLMLTANF
jgi:hypothetical protein